MTILKRLTFHRRLRRARERLSAAYLRSPPDWHAQIETWHFYDAWFLRNNTRLLRLESGKPAFREASDEDRG